MAEQKWPSTLHGPNLSFAAGWKTEQSNPHKHDIPQLDVVPEYYTPAKK